MTDATTRRAVRIPAGGPDLEADLVVPRGARGLVVFAHGAGSSRKSPRNRFVADHLQEGALATLLFDLLTEEEDRSREARFDIPLLAERMGHALDWAGREPLTRSLVPGAFGASTGAAAALVAAAHTRSPLRAVVSRGGRPDMAKDALARVRAPTLLVVGERDEMVLELNRRAASELSCLNEVVLVPGATHLFEEPGTLEAAAGHARRWFRTHLEEEPKDAPAGS